MTVTVYGPYERPDGRKHVIHYDSDSGTRRTQSYPRYLMEQHLGRQLESWEQVDHINGDHTDDRLDNFQLLTHKENNIKAISETGRSAKVYLFKCPVCSKDSEIPYPRYRYNQLVQGKSGPFCSKSCAAKASR